MNPNASELARVFAPVQDGMQRMREVVALQLADASPAVRDMVEHVSRFQGKQLRAALVLLTKSDLVNHPYNITGGPAAKLANSLEKLKGPSIKGKLSLRIEIVFLLLLLVLTFFFSSFNYAYY